MEYIGTINFDLVELPTWKPTPVASGYVRMSELLSEIVEFKRRYDNLPQKVQFNCNSTFAKVMAVEFVHKTNAGESVGLQSREDVESVINAYANSHDIYYNERGKIGMKEEEINQRMMETINIYKALAHASKLREEMENTGKLTVQQICGMHNILMTGLRDDAGEIRKHRVYTLSGKNKEIHLYPEPAVAEQILYACVDHHCIQMSRHLERLSSPIEPLSTTTVEFIFKRAARLLFDFVDAHPFGDGNGRTCRLLANYVISLITPFPVVPCCGEGKNMKDDYLKAIIECRDHRDKGPGALASMLIEDTWRGWKRLFKSIN